MGDRIRSSDKKYPALLAVVIMMLLLCNRPVVFAMENPEVSDSLSPGETESEGETDLPPGPDSETNPMPELDSKTDLPLESDSETNPSSETGDSNDTKNPSDVNTPATVTDTAATAEELLAWLDAYKSGSGTLELTADIYMEDFSFMNNRSKELTIDTKRIFHYFHRGSLFLVQQAYDPWAGWR